MQCCPKAPDQAPQNGRVVGFGKVKVADDVTQLEAAGVGNDPQQEAPNSDAENEARDAEPVPSVKTPQDQHHTAEMTSASSIRPEHRSSVQTPAPQSQVVPRISKDAECGSIAGTSRITRFPYGLVLPPPPRLATFAAVTNITIQNEAGAPGLKESIIKRDPVLFEESSSTPAKCGIRCYDPSNKRARLAVTGGKPLMVRPDEKLFIEAAVALSNISQSNAFASSNDPPRMVAVDEAKMAPPPVPMVPLAAPPPLPNVNHF